MAGPKLVDMTTSIAVLAAKEVEQLLLESPESVIDCVRQAYRQHHRGNTVVPHSTFLRFPDDDSPNRIIGLPAYLGADGDQDGHAGMKWIASFPGNIDQGLPRASAAILLNSTRTGQPVALLEGASISAHRTAASAALAAKELSGPAPVGLSLIGCGVINLAVFRYVHRLLPSIRRVLVHDVDPERAADLARRLPSTVDVEIASSLDEALGREQLISFATNSGTPYTGLAGCQPGAVVLHVSLRDLQADALLGARNVVDDVDHVDRERTSIHLATTKVGHRDFIEATIGGLLDGVGSWRRDDRVSVFSPFGLGVLDIALASWVLDRAQAAGTYTAVPW